MDPNAQHLREKFWAEDAQKGSPIGKPYKEIEFLAEHTQEEGRALREEKLNRIIEHAKKHSAFYADIKSSELAHFPVMNKTSYLEHYNEIKVNRENIPNQVGEVHIQSTSGSTGTPFAIPQDTLKRQRRIAELKYFGKIVGFDTHESLIHLRTWNKWQNKTPEQIKSENIYPFDIANMSDSKIEELCKLINEVNALCLRGYASSFDLLAKYVEQHPQVFPSLKICIAGSEALQDDVRTNVKKHLKCEIISQYANEECGILAQERTPTNDKDNAMYLNHAGYFFEILRMESNEPADFHELGRVVVTDLHNYAFPIIRYDTGDIGTLAPPNEHSNGYPVLEKLYGRRFDICYTTRNEPFFPMTIGRILKHYDCISQWQFIQKGQKEYQLKVIAKGDDAVSRINTAIDNIKEHIGYDADISIEYVSGIPVLASGKRKTVVNEWKK